MIRWDYVIYLYLKGEGAEPSRRIELVRFKASDGWQKDFIESFYTDLVSNSQLEFSLGASGYKMIDD